MSCVVVYCLAVSCIALPFMALPCNALHCLQIEIDIGAEFQIEAEHGSEIGPEIEILDWG